MKNMALFFLCSSHYLLHFPLLIGISTSSVPSFSTQESVCLNLANLQQNQSKLFCANDFWHRNICCISMTRSCLKLASENLVKSSSSLHCLVPVSGQLPGPTRAGEKSASLHTQDCWTISCSLGHLFSGASVSATLPSQRKQWARVVPVLFKVMLTKMTPINSEVMLYVQSMVLPLCRRWWYFVSQKEKKSIIPVNINCNWENNPSSSALRQSNLLQS